MANNTIFSGTSRYSSDFQSVIDRAVSIQSLHLSQLSSEKTRLTDQATALTTLQSKFSSLSSSLAAIGSAIGLDSFSSSTSNDGVVSLKLSDGVSEGSYKIRVTALGAQTSTMSKDGLNVVADPSKANITAGSEFTLAVNGESVTIAPEAQTLESLADAINAAGAGVRATIVNIGSSSAPDYRLSLSSDAYDAVSITLADGATELLDTLATGSKATYTVNGVPVETDSRTVTLSPGLSMTLVGESAAGVDTTVTVSRTTASVKNALSAFATAYNAAVEALDAHRGQAGGALAGDMLIRTLGDALRDVAGYQAPSGDLGNLTALGFTFTDKGRLEFNASGFDAAAGGNPDAVMSVLNGFVSSANSTLSAVAGSNSGAIDTASDLVASMIESQDKLIDAEQDRVDLFRQQMTERIGQADALIAGLEQQVTFYTGMFESMRIAQQMYSA